MGVLHSRGVKGAVLGPQRHPGDVDEAKGGAWHGGDGGFACRHGMAWHIQLLAVNAVMPTYKQRL